MSNRSRTVVIDAGHGGTSAVGASSSNNAVGPNGLMEKDLTLDLARRIRTLLGNSADVILTRDAGVNLSLSERASKARRSDADLFVSLHWNGTNHPDVDATESWIARRANVRSRRFARRMVDRVARITGAPNRGVREKDLGVLLPSRHAAETGACLIELAYLSNAIQARRLERDEYREDLARGIAESIREDLEAGAPAAGASFALGMGDGSPFTRRATDDCWDKCKRLLAGVKDASSPNAISAARILAETGVKADANPYAGLTEKKLNAVIRAAFESHLMPEVLLALWAKEGSTRMQTAAREISQAKSEANAKSIFRSEEYYIALGTDHFIDTTRPSPTGDNVWDSSDAAAPAHEKHFVRQVQALVKAGSLAHEISGDINAELTVTKSGGKFSVTPSMKFYALSLLLADAFFTQLLGMSYPEMSSLSIPINYLHWNMSEDSFKAFLKSAELHRKEPAHRVGGNPITIERWALHTKVAAKEYFQARTNAIRFLHYIDSYRPIFSNSITLIKPGIEDLPQVPANVAEAGALQAAGTTEGLQNYILKPSAETNAGLSAALKLLDRYKAKVDPAKVSFRVTPEKKSRLGGQLSESGHSFWDGATPAVYLLQSAYDTVAAQAAGTGDSVAVHGVIRTIGHELHHLWRAKIDKTASNPIEGPFTKEAARRLEEVRQNWIDFVKGNPQLRKKMKIPDTVTVKKWTDIPAAERDKIEKDASDTDFIQGLHDNTTYLVEEMYTRVEEIAWVRAQQTLGSAGDIADSKTQLAGIAKMINFLNNVLHSVVANDALVTPRLLAETDKAMLVYLRDRYKNAKDSKLDSYTVLFFLSASELSMAPIFDSSGALISKVPKGARVP
jgi:N-acetylmuramoyl-L-alanine amidase